MLFARFACYNVLNTSHFPQKKKSCRVASVSSFCQKVQLAKQQPLLWPFLQYLFSSWSLYFINWAQSILNHTQKIIDLVKCHQWQCWPIWKRIIAVILCVMSAWLFQNLGTNEERDYYSISLFFFKEQSYIKIPKNHNRH